MEIKSSLFKLCLDASTWSMVTILRLGCIQVKGKIVRIMTWICREGWLISNLVVPFLNLFWVRVGFKFSLFYWRCFESELDSSFLYYDWRSLFRTRRVLWSTNNLLGVAFNEFQENLRNL